MGISFILGSMWLAAQTSSIASPTTAKPTTLQEFVASPGYQANIARLFASLPPDVFQRCNSLVSKGSRTTVIQPATFDGDGHPVSGVWKQSFPVSGCGNDTTFNFFFAGQPGGKVLSMTAAPGDTRADPQLQRDAVRYVTIAAMPSAMNCTAMHVRGTTYDGPTATQPVGGKPIRQPWRETWSVSACGQVIDVPVTFIPDATGTTISTQAVKPAAR